MSAADLKIREIVKRDFEPGGRFYSADIPPAGEAAPPMTAESTATSDPIRPSYYTEGEIECIDAIRAIMSPQEFRAFLRGTALKYIWRLENKGRPLEDAQKAQWYIGRLVFEIGKQEKQTKKGS